MKNLSIIYCGLLFVLVAPWCSLILGSNIQPGSLQAGAADEGDTNVFPKITGGLAAQGRQVYIEMGCVYCHTQQPRADSAELLMSQTVKTKTGSTVEDVFVKSDIARAWAKRGAVARDYIYQDHPLLGIMRNGPDLANVGTRSISAAGSDWLYLHLYDPQITSAGSMMPPFRFLFKTQKIGDHPSPLALKLPEKEGLRAPEGYEVVPTDRAIALVAYLRSLSQDYELPEAHFAK